MITAMMTSMVGFSGKSNRRRMRDAGLIDWLQPGVPGYQGDSFKGKSTLKTLEIEKINVPSKIYRVLAAVEKIRGDKREKMKNWKLQDLVIKHNTLRNWAYQNDVKLTATASLPAFVGQTKDVDLQPDKLIDPILEFTEKYGAILK